MNIDGPYMRSACIMGGPLTGKTGMLAARACRLAVDADGGRSVLFLVAAPVCARTVRALIERELGGRSRLIRVALPEDLAFEVLGEHGVAESSGRSARLMEPFEERFLLEDMRACQVKGRRLRDVLGFLKCGLSRLDDDDAQWIQTAEERVVIEHLRANLAFTGGIPSFELANLAVHALRGDSALRDHMAYNHVLIDDFGMLDRASQQLAELLANTSITVAGDTAPAIAVHEAFPFNEGFAEFLAMHPDADATTLEQGFQSPEIALSMNRLRIDEGIHTDLFLRANRSGSGDNGALQGNSPAVRFEPCVTMGDELQTIFNEVKGCIDAGGTALVVGTNSVWRANVAKALETGGIAVDRPERTIRVGDCRDDAANSRAIESTMLRLEQDPTDGVAWRCAMGFGDYMARSAALDRLRSIAQPLGMRIDRALAALAEGDLDGADPTEPLLATLLARYRQICADLQERAIRKATGAEENFGSADGWDRKTSDPVDGDSTASDGDMPAVAVVSPSEAFGRQADLVVFGGFVNGFIPSRDYLDSGKLLGSARRHARETDVRSIHLAASRARSKLVFCGFSIASLEVAERLGLHIARIRLRDGIRSCDIETSELLEVVMPRPSP